VQVQRSFTATLDREPRTGLGLVLDIWVDRSGNPHCHGLRLTCDPSSTGSISTSTYRALNLATLVHQAFRDALVPITRLDSQEGELVFERRVAESSELDSIVPQGVKRSKQRKPLGDDELRLTAQFYVSASAEGVSPTKSLAERFNVNRSTARRWVQRAVERGFLDAGDRLDSKRGAQASRRSSLS